LLTGILPTPKLLGPGLGLFYFLDELRETVRNCQRRGGLVVLSKPPPDHIADLPTPWHADKIPAA
jgi:hypothetical protein